MIRIRPQSSLFLVAGLATLASAQTVVGCSGDDAKTGDEANITEGMDDPFAKLVLDGGCEVKDARTGRTFTTAGEGGACPTTVKSVLDKLEAATGQKPNAFVVSERGDQPGPSTAYRFVLTQPSSLGGPETIFLSVADFGGGFSEGFIEVMSFSEKKKAYNFYDVENGGWQLVGDGTMVDPAGGAPAFKCINCHTTGAPLMKELQDSWNNWDSTWFSTPDPGKDQETFKRIFSQKQRADTLEDHVVEGTKLHVAGYVDRALEAGQLKPLLRQVMCDVGEPNLIATHTKSSQRFGEVKAPSFMFFPPSILLTTSFKTARTGSGRHGGYSNLVELAIPTYDSLQFSGDSYSKAVATLGQTIGGEPGDAIFGLFTPDRSYVDNLVIEELMRRELLTKDMVVDLLMAEFTVPAFSKLRCDLAETAPDAGTTADEIRTRWIENLSGSSLPGASNLQARLENTMDLADHEARIETYLKACKARNDADPDAYALDVVTIISQRRKEFTEVYEAVVESPDLLPTDSVTTPHSQRLSPTTCTLQAQSEPFEEGGTGTGTGTGSGTGTSTGTGTGTSCAHDECSEGAALDAACSPCAAAVCGADSFCCDNTWDDQCVTAATNEPACNCN